MMRWFDRKTLVTFSYCFLVSFAILMITSKNSFLYPFNDWVDANAFFTGGKGMMNGLVPYRDIFEQKGPLLYFIYGLGYLFSNTSFLGVFLLEVLFGTVTLYYSLKVITLFLPKTIGYFFLPIYMLLLCMSYSFVGGGSAEEFCLPFLTITLYHLISNFKEKEIDNKKIFISGICSGCILLIKYTLLGFHFAFFISLFVYFLFDKKYQRAFSFLMIFLLGMVIPIFIFCLYFGVHHAIGNFLEVYFKINMTFYGDTTISFLQRFYLLGKIYFLSSILSGFLEFILVVFMPAFFIKIKLE